MKGRRFVKTVVRARRRCREKRRKKVPTTSIADAQMRLTHGEQLQCAVVRGAVRAIVRIEQTATKIVARSGNIYHTIIVPFKEYEDRLWRASGRTFAAFLTEMARSTRIYIRESKPMDKQDVLTFMNLPSWPKAR